MSTLTATTPAAVSASPAKPVCRHCGSPLIDERMRQSGFCCDGCGYVFRLVHEHSLENYYQFKDEVTAPAGGGVFQPKDYSWLETAQTSLESQLPAGQAVDYTVGIQGISCAACVWLIERIFLQQPGAREIIINVQYGKARLRWTRGEFSAADFARKLQAFGYLIGPASKEAEDPESQGLGKRIGLCAAFAMNVMLFSLPTYFGMESSYEWAGLFGLLNVIFGTLSLLVGGTYFIDRAARALRQGSAHLDLPISIGLLGAYLGSLYGWLAGREEFVYFDFVSAFTLLMLVGRWAQVSAVERNRRRLLQDQPTAQPLSLTDGTQISPENIRADQEFCLEPGQTNPVEMRLNSNEGTFSLASINGEAEPRSFSQGQRVPSGAVNVSRQRIAGIALQGWTESLLAQLLETHERPAERDSLLNVVVRWYLVGIIGIACLSGIGWWIGSHDPLKTWAVVTAVLVVSCPCAVALAFPLADEFATVALRKRGVFVREHSLWSRLNRVRNVIFDKTGTLTLETPVLQNPEAIDALDEGQRFALLRLVQDNPHPISQALTETLLARGTRSSHARDLVEEPGCGVREAAWSLGRAGWSDDGRYQEGTVFAYRRQVLAVLRFSDTVRSDAADELAALRQRGLQIAILSGDSPQKVARSARELNLPEGQALGGLSPAEKATWISTHAPDDALMLGDGVNDSLAFDRALCRGTPVIHRGVLEKKADFYYLGRGISGIRSLFEVNTLRRRTHVAVLIFSVAYNALAVGLAVAGKVNPLVAATLMPINSLLTFSLVMVMMRKARTATAPHPL